MAENSAISWTDHTMNFWIGCTKVSPACTNCYAAVDTFARRERSHGNELWGPHANRHRTSAALWKKPYTWNKQTWRECIDCGKRGKVGDGYPYYLCTCGSRNNNPTRQRVFVSSLSDICEFHPQITDNMRAEIALMVIQCDNLDFLFLTKRPENFNALWLPHFEGMLPDNLWVGTTVENQKYADERIPELLKIDAKVRFLSCEPLLGPVKLFGFNSPTWGFIGTPIHWVIAGGESGSKARPTRPDWFSWLRDQCKAAGVAFHFKQWGEWSTDGAEVNGNTPAIFTKDMEVPMWKIGKKKSGRLLDGVEHNEFPK
jgi:protein gp37